jgi:hypothetical protein
VDGSSPSSANVGALASLNRAVEVCRQLSLGNSDKVERRVNGALALVERGNATLVLTRTPGSEPADRETAKRDFTDAVTRTDTTGSLEGYAAKTRNRYCLAKDRD